MCAVMAVMKQRNIFVSATIHAAAYASLTCLHLLALPLRKEGVLHHEFDGHCPVYVGTCSYWWRVPKCLSNGASAVGAGFREFHLWLSASPWSLLGTSAPELAVSHWRPPEWARVIIATRKVLGQQHLQTCCVHSGLVWLHRTAGCFRAN